MNVVVCSIEDRGRKAACRVEFLKCPMKTFQMAHALLGQIQSVFILIEKATLP